MNDEYRQKLLNWFSTVLLIWAGTVLSLLITLFVTVPELRTNGLEGDALAAVFAEALIMYALFVIPTLFWHLLDFSQKHAPLNLWGRRICSYPAFLAVLSLVTSLWLLAGTGYFTHNSCDDLDGAYFHECYITISLWIMIPLLLGILALAVICLTKFFAAFDSLFLRAK